MKAILLSIRPEWLAKILNGEKTIEVRKKFPKDYVGWVYLYCSKGKKKEICVSNDYGVSVRSEQDFYNMTTYNNQLNGKVVARFWCDETYDIIYGACALSSPRSHELMCREVRVDLEEQSCLTQEQLSAYLGKCKKTPVAIHISKLEIFDKPKELNEFETTKQYLASVSGQIQPILQNIRLTKAPQNYCYVEGD